MVTLVVNTDNKEAREAIERLDASLRGQPAARRVAKAGAELTCAHLFGLANSRHRKGMGVNFYARAADSVIAEPVEDGAEISIPHTGMALRYYGGTVRASGRISLVTGKPITRLAIPIKGTEAEGHTPGEFTGLFVVASKKSGKAILAGHKASGMVAALFVLVPSVTFAPDHGVLPTDEQYQGAAIGALQKLLEATNGLA